MPFEVTQNTMQLSQPAQIAFPEYEKLKQDVLKLVEGMKGIEVTEDKIQVNRKLLTEIRKNFTLLDDERKRIKRQVLEPYNELEDKVKELKQYLDEGEEHIKNQITTYENQQRLEREIALSEMFYTYMSEYNAPSWLDFESFKQKYPKTLNKTCSEIEKRRSIINWFETFENEYKQLKQEFPDKSVRTAILTSYKTNGFNMTQAVNQYKQMIEEAERLEAEKQARKQTAVPTFSFEQPAVKKEEKYVTIRVKESDLKKINISYENVK